MPSLINAAPAFDDDTRPSASLLNRTASLAPPPTMADAWDATSKAYGDFVARERADGIAKGLLDPVTGWPTKLGLQDAAKQLADSILMGSTSGGKGSGFLAYHGSPHSFDAFKTEAIGTGEGVQAYGHGLYLADKEAIAQGYRDRLAASEISHSGLSPSTADAISVIQQRTPGAGLDELKQFANQIYDPYDRAGTSSLISREIHDGIADGRITQKLGGHMYEVQVNADPAHFLDWDKPLSEQSPKVQKMASDFYGQPYATLPDTKTGEVFYRDLTKFSGNPAVASTYLQQAGVPGLRYLDGGSRANGEGTSNHVVFDANSIEILRRYGIAGLMAGSAAAATQGEPGPTW